MFDAGEIRAKLVLELDQFQRDIETAKAEGEEGVQVPVNFEAEAAQVEAVKEAVAAPVTVPVNFDVSSVGSVIDALQGAGVSRGWLRNSADSFYFGGRNSRSAGAYAFGLPYQYANNQLPDLRSSAAAALLGGIGGEGGAGGGGGGGAGGGFMGRAGGLAEARVLSALGVPATGAAALALSMPVLISLGAALFTAAAGFTALGAAAGPAAVHLASGYSAIDTANTALQQAVPGTLAYAQAIQQVGTAWSGVDLLGMQGPMQAIMSLFSGKSALLTQGQNWLGGLVENLVAHFSQGGSVFSPLVLATEGAVDKLVLHFESMMGSGKFAHLIDLLASRVGPDVSGLAKIADSIVRIFIGLGKAGVGGEGLTLLDSVFKTIATLVNSGVLAGFAKGFVDVDRAVLSIANHLITGLDALSKWISFPAAKMVGGVLGTYFAISRVLRLAGISGGVRGAVRSLSGGSVAESAAAGSAGTETALGAAISEVLAPAALLAVGGYAAYDLAGAHQNMPKGFWNAVLRGRNPYAVAAARGIAFGPRAYNPGSDSYLHGGVSVSAPNTRLINSVLTYKDALSGLIPVIGSATKAQNQFTSVWDKSGGALYQAAYGGGTLNRYSEFTKVARTTSQSFSTMVENLQARNRQLAGWEGDLGALMLRVPAAMRPALSTIAQEAPQDLATMVKAFNSSTPAARKAVTGMMNAIAEQMLLGQLAADHSISQFTGTITKGLTSKVPAIRNAAMQIASAMNLPVPIIEGRWTQAIDRIASLIGATARQAQHLLSNPLTAPRFAHSGYTHRAGGGPVSALDAYIVGEHGPELFVPGMNGTIVPNGAVRRRGHPGNIQIIVQVDARGATSPAATKSAVSGAVQVSIPKMRQAIAQGIGAGRS